MDRLCPTCSQVGEFQDTRTQPMLEMVFWAQIVAYRYKCPNDHEWEVPA